MHLRSAPADFSVQQHRLAAADRIGATASLLCALHCAALPFVLAVLPTLGLGFLADHLFERIFIACASALAITVLWHGYRRHHDRRALTLLVPGLVLLWTGGFLVDGHDTIGLHALLVVLGGSCVALAHLTNLRLQHGQDCDCVTAA
jgi:hypothetical protein